MALESDLAAQTILIYALVINALEFVLKLMLLRCEPKVEFDTSTSRGHRMQLVFVDEEGTKIQTTMFGRHIEKWRKLLDVGKTYFIVNRKVGRHNSLYPNVNSEKDLSFTPLTEVKPCSLEFSTKSLSDGFCTFRDIDNANDEQQLDVVGITLHVRAVVETKRSIRREVTIINERNVRKVITLWGKHAKHEGAQLEMVKHGRPIVAFCNMWLNMYLGIAGLKST